MLFSCKNIQKYYSSNIVLENISFVLEDKERAAVIGVNGAGKTTLFRIIVGEILADSGTVFFPNDISIGYFSQDMHFNSSNSIYDELLSAFDYLIALENKIRDVERSLASLSGSALESQLKYYSNLQHSFEVQNGYGYRSRVNGVLKGLGFTDDDSSRIVNTLSGGEKTRVYLGKMLLANADLLLLDEPTNHLDIPSVSWLEDFLRSYPKSMLIISHDRFFLDKVCTKIIEIENSKSTVYEGDYSHYAKLKEKNREALIKNYIDQQKLIKRQEEAIKVLRSFNREKSIKRAESKEKLLSKMDFIEKPENLPDKMRLILEPKIQSGEDVLSISNISVSFGEMMLFKNADLSIHKGEKVALIGPNGIGKTTLLRVILGQMNSNTGSVKLGTNVKIGYYDQQHQSLDEDKSIFDYISDSFPKLTSGEIRNILAAFVFCGDDVFKLCSSLSGGEKGRVLLAKLMIAGANFLILDEPTNHLDMYSKEILEDALNNFNGTVLYVSHDRYFINRTAQKVYELTPSAVLCYMGNYSYYLEKKAEALNNNFVSVDSHVKKESVSKEDWIRKKEYVSSERKRQALIKKIEDDIEQYEAQVSELDNLLTKEEIYSNSDKVNDIYENKVLLENILSELIEKWEEVTSN